MTRGLHAAEHHTQLKFRPLRTLLGTQQRRLGRTELSSQVVHRGRRHLFNSVGWRGREHQRHRGGVDGPLGSGRHGSTRLARHCTSSPLPPLVRSHHQTTCSNRRQQRRRVHRPV